LRFHSLVVTTHEIKTINNTEVKTPALALGKEPQMSRDIRKGRIVLLSITTLSSLFSGDQRIFSWR
jgi:hypothetical protein